MSVHHFAGATAPRARPRLEPLDDRLAPAITFRFDYSLDASGFFNDPAARSDLERAGAAVGSLFQDALAPIRPNGFNTWRTSFLNPATNRTIRFDDLTVGANEILVFAVGGALPDRDLAVAVNGGAIAQGSRQFEEAVIARGQAGALADPAADNGPWGGIVAFDTRVDWDLSAGDPNSERFDFESVAVHELAHILGFGAGTPSFDRFVTPGGFVGPTVQAVFGGPAPLESTAGPDHWAQGTESDGREAALTPAVPDGVRKPLTTLDIAALVDVGWLPTPPPPAPPPPPPPPQPPPVPTGSGPARITVGAGPGGLPVVARLDAQGGIVSTFPAFPDGFPGGVRVAVADFDADGVPDVAVGTGPGAATRVRVLAGTDQRELFSIVPFESSFTGGVYVAAGDTDRDGVPELVITPDEGGGPRVRVFDGDGFAQRADFFGIDDPNFRGGARAAIGDVTGDGAGDLIVAAGFGGGPRVAGFDGPSLATQPQKVFGDFFAFEQTLRNGVFVAAGDLDGDGFAEVIAGAGPGGGPRVTAFGGRALVLFDRRVARADFFAGFPENRGGIRVATTDLDGDQRADLVAGAGNGAGSGVSGYLGANLSPAGPPPAVFEYSVFPGFTGGVYVG